MDVLTEIDQVERILPEWEALHDAASEADPFVGPRWLVAWWRSYARPDWAMRFLMVRLDGRLAGVAPLMIRRERRFGRSCRVLRLWAESYSFRINFLASDRDRKQALDLVVQHLDRISTDWDLAEFGPMALGATTTTSFVRSLDEAGRRWGAETSFSSPFCRLPATPDELENLIGSGVRRSLRRKGRKAGREGASMEFTRSADRLDDVFRISEETWQTAKGTGLAATVENRRFFTRLINDAAARGELRLAFLDVESLPVAFELNLAFRGTLYNLSLGYRTSHSSLSPGVVLRRFVIRRAVEEGFAEMDFMGMAEPYKLEWATGTRDHGHIVLAGSSPSWRLTHLVWFRIRPWLRRSTPSLFRAKRRLQRLIDGVSGTGPAGN